MTRRADNSRSMNAKGDPVTGDGVTRSRGDRLHDRVDGRTARRPLARVRAAAGVSRYEDEVGIAERAELGHVEALDLGLGRDPDLMNLPAILKMRYVTPQAQTKPTTTWTTWAPSWPPSP